MTSLGDVPKTAPSLPQGNNFQTMSDWQIDMRETVEVPKRVIPLVCVPGYLPRKPVGNDRVDLPHRDLPFQLSLDTDVSTSRD